MIQESDLLLGNASLAGSKSNDPVKHHQTIGKLLDQLEICLGDNLSRGPGNPAVHSEGCHPD